ncbi:hypothetical protein C5167_009425 [Papaver somniferum]|uniref:NADH-quinone oxidoreductase subunit D domain-containing protein n=1 Tax=Papaver somniferum TaxID=3469 RepID=A0A4Y7K084_PAPSO|nr:hypothetical protein C5167_009425 [Papaver somniferum]
MGPHHPSMHGVLRLIITLDGEDVIDCEPILSYLHIGMEKIAENRTIIQYLPYVTRWDYLATMFTEEITVNGPEQLGNIQVPKRARYIRVIMLELSRIASHLLWLGPFMADIGAQTPFFYIFRERELIYDLFEAATERVEGVGVVGGEEAINWGLSGPMLRASGIQWDLLKVDHYECYDEFDWEVQWQKEGDSLARYLVRIGEMTESIKIIQQALEGIPGGPYENLEARRFDKAGDSDWNDFDYRFISTGQIIYAALTSPGQRNLKKRIAYSSVSHMGFTIIGIASVTDMGLNGAILQIISHGFIGAALFFLAETSYDRIRLVYLDEMGGIAIPMPKIFTMFSSFSMASLALPGMSGFVVELLTR